MSECEAIPAPLALTLHQRDLLAAILPSVERGLRVRGTVEASGQREGQIRYVLERLGFTGSWPPDPRRIRQLLALPVHGHAPHRDRALAGGPPTDAPRLTADEIARRRDEAQARRREYETRWLAAEANRYPGLRPRKPLSAMPL